MILSNICKDTGRGPPISSISWAQAKVCYPHLGYREGQAHVALSGPAQADAGNHHDAGLSPQPL